MIDDQLFNVLFNPIGYAHPSHLPSNWLYIDRAGEPILNYWLHSRYKLEALPTYWVAPDERAVILLQNWNKLPTVAHLIGGYLLRTSLLKRGLALYQDPLLQAFISLPLRYHVRFENPSLKFPDTQACGATFILCQHQSLPHALKQRFQLLFSTGMMQAKLLAPIEPDNINLFTMAITYANNFHNRTSIRQHTTYQIEPMPAAAPVG